MASVYHLPIRALVPPLGVEPRETSPFERDDFANLSTGALYGGSGETRTHDKHRMKVAH